MKTPLDLDELETLLNRPPAPKPAGPSPGELRRRREVFLKALEEVEAALSDPDRAKA